MIIEDDRTDEQKKTHTCLWGGTDTFMSGWGQAKGGSSYAFWACEPKLGYLVERWVRNRGDIKRVRQVMSNYKPTATGHCHIYVVGDNHPAIS